MNDETQYVEVFIDLLPNQPKDDQSRDNLRLMLREKLEQRLNDSIERIWDLPPLIVKPGGDYLHLLTESRNLYIDGHFYSCVAMCGIVGERIIKDAFGISVLVKSGNSMKTPSEKAFDQIEHVEISGLIRFLKEAEIISDDAARAAIDLGQLRNKYVHARGQSPKDDALKAIKLLHALVEDTVSILKDFEIKEGALVAKGVSAARAPNRETVIPHSD